MSEIEIMSTRSKNKTNSCYIGSCFSQLKTSGNRRHLVLFLTSFVIQKSCPGAFSIIAIIITPPCTTFITLYVHRLSDQLAPSSNKDYQRKGVTRQRCFSCPYRWMICGHLRLWNCYKLLHYFLALLLPRATGRLWTRNVTKHSIVKSWPRCEWS